MVPYRKGLQVLARELFLDDDDPEYKLIAECNSLLAEIENEIAVVHRVICGKYQMKLPELE